MTEITIQLKDKEEEIFIESFLKRMRIPFQKNDADHDDFELTEEMKRVIDERLEVDRNEAADAWESLRKI